MLKTGEETKDTALLNLPRVTSRLLCCSPACHRGLQAKRAVLRARDDDDLRCHLRGLKDKKEAKEETGAVQVLQKRMSHPSRDYL